MDWIRLAASVEQGKTGMTGKMFAMMECSEREQMGRNYGRGHQYAPDEVLSFVVLRRGQTCVHETCSCVTVSGVPNSCMHPFIDKIIRDLSLPGSV